MRSYSPAKQLHGPWYYATRRSHYDSVQQVLGIGTGTPIVRSGVHSSIRPRRMEPLVSPYADDVRAPPKHYNFRTLHWFPNTPNASLSSHDHVMCQGRFQLECIK